MTVVEPQGAALLEAFQGFVHELRVAGLPVSMTENLDAMRGLEHVGLAERETLRAVLGATLVKHERHLRAFDLVFDLWFGSRPAAGADDAGSDGSEVVDGQGDPAGDGGAGGAVGREELAEMLLRALAAMDRDELRRLAAAAVSAFAGIEAGRPVGGTYYLYRTLRALDLEDLEARLVQLAAAEAGDDPLRQRLARDEQARRIRDLRALVEAEIRRRLVADRGIETMARVLRRPLPEDVDFMHASRQEMLELQRIIQPLARSLAARLAQRRRRRRRGHLDFRRTIRESLSYGGVPAEPRFRDPRPSKPEILVVADVSGSVASFARFTLQFVHAMANEFSHVRSWVFVDGLDEVTRFFDEADDVAEAIHRVNTEADVIWVDGHSDYGHAFEVFHEHHAREVTQKSSVIVLGDARNNYHAPRAELLGDLRRRAKHLHWLNPEPRSYWDTGDSVIGEYAPYCDGVHECRTLRQLERFVAVVAERG